eukprot:6471679-Amphidinium_carterae.1
MAEKSIVSILVQATLRFAQAHQRQVVIVLPSSDLEGIDPSMWTGIAQIVEQQTQIWTSSEEVERYCRRACLNNMPPDWESEVLSCLEKQVQIDSERKALLALPVRKGPVVPLQQALPMTSFL